MLKNQLKRALSPYVRPYLQRLRTGTLAPLLGAGIRIDKMDLANGTAIATLPLGALNSNSTGAHFHGSMLMMAEAFIVPILSHFLGASYAIEIDSSEVQIVRHANTNVRLRVQISQAHVQQILKSSSPYTHSYRFDVSDGHFDTVAKVRLQLTIRQLRG